MRKFGVFGKSLSHSFSPGYFEHKFKLQNITDAAYEAYEVPDAQALKEKALAENLLGFNITIPYKKDIIPLLDEIDELTSAIGSVNTVKITDGKLKGYNTDHIGFGESLIRQFLRHDFEGNALILGTGGVSNAISYVLTELIIPHKFVSTSGNGDLSYDDLTDLVIREHELIINCTPLGTFPKVDEAPDIPYQAVTSNHMAMDLIYNPEETRFLTECKKQGARTKNGMEMLTIQAEASWMIWNE